MKILVMASEVVPFAKTGGLADVAGALPGALKALGNEVRVALPMYSEVKAKGLELAPVADISVEVGALTKQGVLYETTGDGGVPVWLLDCPEYFEREQLYGYADDDARFIFYQKAILAACEQLGWRPDVIHCNDWQTGFVPVFLKTTLANSEFFKGIATVYTIHNLAYQGLFGGLALHLAGLPGELNRPEGVEFYGGISFMKAGIQFADYVNTVSEGYAREIRTPEYGERLDDIISARGDRVVGILNGIDYSLWSPETDKHLVASYSPKQLAGKAKCKADLQITMGLPESVEAPLFGMVTRLSSQKGLDLFEEAFTEVLERELQVVVLGTGDPQYHELMTELATKYPTKFAVMLGFSNELAHKIYAGADIFLMPSRYEPCGLSQIISLKYGTVPLVRKTGGLADTITEFSPAAKEGNGFVFSEYTGGAFAETIKRSLLAWEAGKGLWKQLRLAGMAADFSWAASANEYADLYKKAVEAAAE